MMDGLLVLDSITNTMNMYVFQTMDRLTGASVRGEGRLKNGFLFTEMKTSSQHS